MNVKRFVSASLAVYVVSLALGFLIHGVILKPTYDSLASIWRPDMNSLMWIVWVNGLITSVIFTYIFAKGYEGKGIMEGARFGAIVGLFVSVPMAYGTYMMFPIPYPLAFQWFLYGTVETILLGITAAAVYKPSATAVKGSRTATA